MTPPRIRYGELVTVHGGVHIRYQTFFRSRLGFPVYIIAEGGGGALHSVKLERSGGCRFIFYLATR